MKRIGIRLKSYNNMAEVNILSSLPTTRRRSDSRRSPSLAGRYKRYSRYTGCVRPVTASGISNQKQRLPHIGITISDAIRHVDRVVSVEPVFNAVQDRSRP